MQGHAPESEKFAAEQLARATTQVETVQIGGRTPPSLMVASYLTRKRITSYVLDPDGDDDLWSGTNRDMDDFLAERPADQRWYARPAADRTDDGGSVDASDTAAEPGAPASEAVPPSDLQVFDIPEERRGWFTQILARAAAATTLLFAGDSRTARDYATTRQRNEEVLSPVLFDLDPPWAQSTARTLRLPNGLRLHGTRYRTPLPGGTDLEVFRGVEARLYRMLADGKIGPYLRAAPGFYEKWSRTAPPPGTAVSLSRDGTVLVIRLAPGN